MLTNSVLKNVLLNDKEMATLKDDVDSITSVSSFVIFGSDSSILGIDDALDVQSGSYHKILTESSLNSLKNSESVMETLQQNSLSSLQSRNDIQTKLDQLVKDNILLKETLNKSNLAMKNQFSTLTLWYDEVMKTYQSHKQKFLEGQEQITKLQIENANLKKVIDEKLNMENSSFGNSSFAVVSNSSESIAALKQMLEMSEENCKILTNTGEELRSKNIELERRLNFLMDENLQLGKKLQEKAQIIKNAELTNDKCTRCKNLLDSKNGIEKISELSLNSKMSISEETKAEVDQLKNEIKMLKKQLAEQEESKNAAENMKVQYDALLKDRDELQDTLKVCKSMVEHFKEQFRSMSEQLKSKDEVIDDRTKELEIIKQEMKKMVLDAEEVAILRTQVELYQTDFNEERRAREEAVGEREELKLQLQYYKDKEKSGEACDLYGSHLRRHGTNGNRSRSSFERRTPSPF